MRQTAQARRMETLMVETTAINTRRALQISWSRPPQNLRQKLRQTCAKCCAIPAPNAAPKLRQRWHPPCAKCCAKPAPKAACAEVSCKTAKTYVAPKAAAGTARTKHQALPPAKITIWCHSWGHHSLTRFPHVVRAHARKRTRSSTTYANENTT